MIKIIHLAFLGMLATNIFANYESKNSLRLYAGAFDFDLQGVLGRTLCQRKNPTLFYLLIPSFFLSASLA
jgi:hypothetical protein